MQHITSTGTNINQFITTTNHITTALTNYNDLISCQPYNNYNNITPYQPQTSITIKLGDNNTIKLGDNNMYDEFTADYLKSIRGGFCTASFRITKVEMLAKNKVMRFTFDDTTFLDEDNKLFIVKTVCKPEDTFSIETACYVAIAKYISRGELTPEGISAFADNLRLYKQANKIVAAAVKLYNKSVKEAEKAAALKEELKLVKERQRAKKIRYKEKKKQKNDVK